MKTFGLQNVGSICYFNSLIQALISCEPFISALLICKESENTQLITAFKNFLMEARGTGISKINISALPILSELKRQYDSFGNGQEDVMEGFDALISLMGDDVIGKLFVSTWRMDIFCSACKKVVSINTEKMMRVIMVEDYIPFARTQSIGAFVGGHMSKFTDYNCPTCGAKRAEGINVYRLDIPPPILVISFNKFNGKWLADPVAEIMDVEYGIEVKRMAKYKIVAIIHHSGGRRSGHYTTTAVRGDKIYLFNDSKFIEMESFKSSQNDYILIYTKI